VRRALLSIVVLGAGLATAARADYLADRARPVVEAAHAEIRAVHLGRYVSQGRWEEILDEALWMMAPKGRWSPDHPAWKPARDALARVLRAASVARLAGETGRLVREVVNEHYSSLEPDDAAKAVDFYRSPGGEVFRDFREKVLAESSYGLPYVVEAVPRETLRREMEAAKDRLLNLPDEQTQAVYDFNHSKVGEFLMGVENNIVADVIGNIMRSDMTALLNRDDAPAIVRQVRAAVPNMPPPSDKEYLGTVTMRSDRGFDLAIEYHESFRTAGTYTLSYSRGDRHWQDVAAGVPGIEPGETRFLYRDPHGRLSDAP
jgi:hypothetical protein